jgi:hypothetical protein
VVVLHICAPHAEPAAGGGGGEPADDSSSRRSRSSASDSTTQEQGDDAGMCAQTASGLHGAGTPSDEATPLSVPPPLAVLLTYFASENYLLSKK